MLKGLDRSNGMSAQVSPPRGLFSDRSRAMFATGFILSSAVTALAVWLVASAPGSGPIAPASHTLMVVLLCNLCLILSLAATVGVRVGRLVRSREADAGARLHVRFVTLFAAAAVIPAVVVALFFGVLVTRGVESWFSKDVRTAIENSGSIGQDYLADVGEEMTHDLQAMSNELGQIRPLFQNRVAFSNELTALAEVRGYPALYLISADGTVLARGETPQAPPYMAPPAKALAEVGAGQDAPAKTEHPDAFRVLYPLRDYPGVSLYVVRPLRVGILRRLRAASREVTDYKEREASRARVQIAFGLTYAETALLVLVGAAWLGMSVAGEISRPVARLAQAADRIAKGDLSARVDTEHDPAEIAVLSNAFNRMTTDLQSQQEALRRASDEAIDRSRFIETVLSGVSAGVLGLDEKGRISAVNAQALRLLDLDEADALGKPLRKAAPELAEIVAHSGHSGDHDVDVTRDSETRRLRVRVSGGEEGGLVLTFDDLTRLMTAQRNAAWRDVARRIAHEIKNPLTPIQLSAERLKRKYRDQLKGDLETFDRCTETIIRQVGDIGRMVDEFSSFARMPAPKFAPEDAAELLREQVFAQRVAQPEIDLDLRLPSQHAPFVADGRMVAQALTNVLKNAGEAVMARRAAEPKKFKGSMTASLFEGDEWLTFVIEDDGVGLPDKDRDRLTEPYVTTREKGTGLGLAIVKRICEDHGGELELNDAVELSGARVALSFPRTRAAETPTATPAKTTARA
jgi:two-component system nitrogen regulation sensor histidine kinase NtrY